MALPALVQAIKTALGHVVKGTENRAQQTQTQQTQTEPEKEYSAVAEFLWHTVDFLISMVFSAVYALYRMVRAPIALAVSITAMGLWLPYAALIAPFRWMHVQRTKPEARYQDYLRPSVLLNFILGANEGVAAFFKAHAIELGWSALLILTALTAGLATAMVVPMTGTVAANLTAWLSATGANLVAVGMTSTLLAALAGTIFTVMSAAGLGLEHSISVQLESRCTVKQNNEAPPEIAFSKHVCHKFSDTVTHDLAALGILQKRLPTKNLKC